MFLPLPAFASGGITKDFPVIKWRFSASNSALETATGRKTGEVFKVDKVAGYALFGPYLEIPPGHCVARIAIEGDREGSVTMEIVADKGQRLIASQPFILSRDLTALELTFDSHETLAEVEVRLVADDGATLVISGVEIDLIRDTGSLEPDPNRPVGLESRKTYADKITSGFIDKYLSGPAVLELGYKGYISGTVPIVPQAIGVDLGYPGYDGVTLPFADESFDAIYSSHCFEHIPDYCEVLRDWYRLLKIGGHIIIVVPHQQMFEKKRSLPSPSNPDHRRFYTVESLAGELAEAFEENSYRIRHVAENDQGFNYSDPPKSPSYGCYEIECVVEKIVKPKWNLDDGTVRTYSASEFFTDSPRPNPFTIAVNTPADDRWVIWGPYIRLGLASYQVDFYFDASDLTGELDGDIIIDIASNTESIASLTLSGVDGLAALRYGRVTMQFRNDDPKAVYEFRVRMTNHAFQGVLSFKGVNLDYI